MINQTVKSVSIYYYLPSITLATGGKPENNSFAKISKIVNKMIVWILANTINVSGFQWMQQSQMRLPDGRCLSKLSSKNAEPPKFGGI